MSANVSGSTNVSESATAPRMVGLLDVLDTPPGPRITPSPGMRKLFWDFSNSVQTKVDDLKYYVRPPSKAIYTKDEYKKVDNIINDIKNRMNITFGSSPNYKKLALVSPPATQNDYSLLNEIQQYLDDFKIGLTSRGAKPVYFLLSQQIYKSLGKTLNIPDYQRMDVSYKNMYDLIESELKPLFGKSAFISDNKAKIDATVASIKAPFNKIGPNLVVKQMTKPFFDLIDLLRNNLSNTASAKSYYNRIQKLLKEEINIMSDKKTIMSGGRRSTRRSSRKASRRSSRKASRRH